MKSLSLLILTSLVCIISGEETTSTTKPSQPIPVETTTTMSTTPKTTGVKERRKEMRRIIYSSYERVYYQLSPETYKKMLTVAESCNKELQMDNDLIKNCTVIRMNRKPQGKTPKKSSKQNQPTVTASVVTDDLESKSVSNSSSNSPANDSSNSVLKEPTKSWRDVVRFDQTVVRCFVDQQRKNDPFKKMTRQEWKEERGKLVLDYLNKKMTCLRLKFN